MVSKDAQAVFKRVKEDINQVDPDQRDVLLSLLKEYFLDNNKKNEIIFLFSPDIDSNQFSAQNNFSDPFPGIEKTPGVCGGSACIIRTRIPVWTLVLSKNLGMNDDQLLENYPSLRRQDLFSAWNYYRANKEEIDSEIAENEVD